MAALNRVLNRIDAWSQPVSENGTPQGLFKRHCCTRLGTFFGAAPLAGLIAGKNILEVPFRTTGIALKCVVKPLAWITGSPICLKSLDKSLGTVEGLYKTIVKVIFFTLSSFSSFTLGLASPSCNYRLHCWVGLALREQKVREQFEKEKPQEKEQLDPEALNALVEEINKEITAPNKEVLISETPKESEEAAAADDKNKLADDAILQTVITEDDDEEEVEFVAETKTAVVETAIPVVIDNPTVIETEAQAQVVEITPDSDVETPTTTIEIPVIVPKEIHGNKKLENLNRSWAGFINDNYNYLRGRQKV